MQYPNGRKIQSYTQKAIGGAGNGNDLYFRNRGDRWCRFVGETWSRGAGGLPSGAGAGLATILPVTADGAMSSTTLALLTLTATGTAIVPITAQISGTATCTATDSATLTASGEMSGTSIPYLPLSPENMAIAVWSAPSEYAQSYGKQFRDMRAVLLGTTTGGSSTTETFNDAGGSTPRVVSTNNGANRLTVTVPGA